MRPHGSVEELERRRRRAVAMVQEGQSRAAVARVLDVVPSTVTRWCQAYGRGGDGGLSAKRHPGPKLKLTAYRRRLLGKRLLKGAKANGFSTDLWTCPRIAEVIERHYGVCYHVDHIPKLMASLGWSCQKPEKRAIERDEERIARWVTKDWSRIKKRRTEPRSHRIRR